MSLEAVNSGATITHIDSRRKLIVDEVCKGVFIIDGFPNERLLSSGQYLTRVDFEQAAVDVGISEGRGRGVFNTIAFLSALGSGPTESTQRRLVDEAAAEKLYYRIFYMMKNPDLIKSGSQDKVLLSTQLVHDVYRDIDTCWSVEGSQPIGGKIGRMVLSQVLFDIPPAS